MGRNTTIKKIAAAWKKKNWGFYDLQHPFNRKKLNEALSQQRSRNPGLG
jgi:hypothetical protein